MTNILNVLGNRWIRILQPVRITSEYKSAVRLTLTQDSNFRRRGTPTGTTPMRLNTSIQNTGYNPSKNSFKLPNTNTDSTRLSEGKQRWFVQLRQLYCKGSEMFSFIRDGRSMTAALASRESSSLQMLKRSCVVITLRHEIPSCTSASRIFTRQLQRSLTKNS